MSEVFYFTKEDLIALDDLIRSTDDRIKDILGQAGDSCKGRSDTYHDNFEHEDGMRTSAMWSTRLKELLSMRRCANLVSPPSVGDEVLIGRFVILRDEQTQEIITLKIGSYMVLNRHRDYKIVSYATPFAKIIIGAKAGDVCEGEIAGKKKKFKIIDVK